MNLYKRAFEPIQVPADMAARVERALEARTMPRAEMRRPQRLVFRLAAGLAACLLLTLGLWHLLPASEPVPSGTPGVELSNPFQPVGSPGELSAYLPFTPLLPTGLPDGWEAVSVTAISGTVGEVVYADGANRVCYRTAQGGADISGDYTAYPEVTERDGYTLKGSGGTVSLLLWSDSGMSYCLRFTPAVSPETALGWAQRIGG